MSIDCTCHGGHDPADQRCDRAIVEGTAGPVYAEAPISEHPLQVIDQETSKCLTCDVVVFGSPAVALVQHLTDVRDREAS